MASEGLTRGGIKANAEEHVRLAQLHGDLDAIGIIQGRLRRPIMLAPGNHPPLNWYYQTFFEVSVSFEGKKHLWNMLSRLTSRVDEVIISNRDLRRELIHMAAKGRKA